MDTSLIFWVSLTLLVAVGGATYSLRRDRREAAREQQEADRLEALKPKPEPVALVERFEPVAGPETAGTAPAPIAPARPEVRFGQVFWPAVMAQIFVGFVAWLLWWLATQVK